MKILIELDTFWPSNDAISLDSKIVYEDDHHCTLDRILLDPDSQPVTHFKEKLSDYGIETISWLLKVSQLVAAAMFIIFDDEPSQIVNEMYLSEFDMASSEVHCAAVDRWIVHMDMGQKIAGTLRTILSLFSRQALVMPPATSLTVSYICVAYDDTLLLIPRSSERATARNEQKKEDFLQRNRV